MELIIGIIFGSWLTYAVQLINKDDKALKKEQRDNQINEALAMSKRIDFYK